MWELAVSAALEAKQSKLSLLNALRIKIEILKRLIRLEHELNIITNKVYIKLEKELQEISKMTSGWIKLLTRSFFTLKGKPIFPIFLKN